MSAGQFSRPIGGALPLIFLLLSRTALQADLSPSIHLSDDGPTLIQSGPSAVQQINADMVAEWFPSNDGDRWKIETGGAGGGQPGGAGANPGRRPPRGGVPPSADTTGTNPSWQPPGGRGTTQRRHDGNQPELATARGRGTTRRAARCRRLRRRQGSDLAGRRSDRVRVPLSAQGGKHR